MSGRVLRSSKRKNLEPEPVSSKRAKPDPKATKPFASKRAAVRAKPPVKKEKISKTSVSADADAKSEAVTGERSYWLLKAEPESRIVNGHDVKFSIHDLQALPNQTEHWDGVRNHEAKNNMVKMRVGDYAFFYQSNCSVPGIVGVVEIVRAAYVDFTAFDQTHPYYDAKSKQDKPTWKMVDVKFVRETKRNITLAELKQIANAGNDSRLRDFALVRRARLSVVGVTQQEWDYILSLEELRPES
jgi:predicted RNA-binding protein with PUA-like domain